jgi:hypothetical protein
VRPLLCRLFLSRAHDRSSVSPSEVIKELNTEETMTFYWIPKFRAEFPDHSQGELVRSRKRKRPSWQPWKLRRTKKAPARRGQFLGSYST